MSIAGFCFAAGCFKRGYRSYFSRICSTLTEAGQNPGRCDGAVPDRTFQHFGTLVWGAMGGKWRMKYLLTSIYLLRCQYSPYLFCCRYTVNTLFATAIGLRLANCR